MPTPIHGWRAFWGEVGIIVLGVLIALGAQQLAQSLQDRRTADQTRTEVTDEINSDLMSLTLRAMAEPCVQRRLVELRRIMVDWQRTGTFVTPRWVAQSPVIEIELGRYDSALSSGRLALLSGDEQYRMGAMVNRIRQFQDWQLAERPMWGRLRSLQIGSNALAADDRAIIRAALQDASTFDYEIRVLTAQTLPMARRYGFAPDAKSFRELAPQVWPGGKFTPSICTAINTSPEQGNKRVTVPLPQ